MRLIWLCLAADALVLYSVSGEEKKRRAIDILPEYETDSTQCDKDGDKLLEECNCGRVLTPLRPSYIPDELLINQEWVTVASLALGKSSGRWYFELRYGRGAKMSQVGWATSQFELDSDFNYDGVGDDIYSFGADVERHCKRNGLERPKLVRWMSGELLGSVLGCAIDIDGGLVWFYLNGRRVENSEMIINKEQLPPGTLFFPAVSTKGEYSFTLSWSDLLFANVAKADGLQALTSCKVCRCSWPPKAVSHTCGSDSEDLTVKTDGVIIAQALQSLAPSRCGSTWDCSPTGVFKIRESLLQCDTNTEATVTMSLKGDSQGTLLRRLKERLAEEQLQEDVFLKLFEHPELRLFAPRNISVEISLQEKTTDQRVELAMTLHNVCKKVILKDKTKLKILEDALRSGISDGVGEEHFEKSETTVEVVGGGRVSFLNWYQLGLSGQIPPILGGLHHLEGMYLGLNRLTGSVPSELGRIRHLVRFSVVGNELEGELPTELFSFAHSEEMNFAENDLVGSIPTEVGNLQQTLQIYLYQNRLTGSVPSELGRLTRNPVLWLQGNHLSGSFPSELGADGRSRLSSFKISENSLKGSIPVEFGKLANLRVFRVMNNYLTGTIPEAMANCKKMLKWEIGNNSFRGIVDMDRQWPSLMVYDAHKNDFSGHISTHLGNFPLLYYFNLGRNKLQGVLPTEIGKLKSLQNFWVRRNRLHGQIPSEIGELTEVHNLFLADNVFTGTLPPTLCQMPNLTTIWMSSNSFSGSIPECYSDLVRLKYVLLDRNRLSGQIPQGFARLEQLNALTLNDNFFSGRLHPQGLNMRTYGDQSQVVLMLQRNDLSCELPSSIMDPKKGSAQDGHVLVVLGNMFDGPILPDWVRPQEQRSELLYNSRPGLDVMVWMLLCPCTFVGTVVLWRMLFGSSIWKIVLDAIMAHSLHPLISLYRGLLLACAMVSVIPSMLLLLYRFGSGYYECGQDLAKTTAAYFKSTPTAQWLVILLWCFWLFAVGSFALVIPRLIPGTWENKVALPDQRFRMRRAKYIVGHITWLGAMTLISWPSFLYGIAKTLHDDNVIFFGKFKDNSRKIVFYLAPLTQALMDSLVAPNFAGGYANFFGCSQWTLLVLARAVTTWIVLLATSLVLVENCVGGWKWFWLVCRPHSTDLDFSLSIPNPLDVTYLDTKLSITVTEDDVCAVGSNSRATWWFYHRCDRTLLESLAPFLATRMAVAAFGLPSLYLLRFTHLGVDAGYLLKKQCLALTSVLQVGIIFVPFVPVLMPLVIGAISLHLVACHYWTEKNPDAQLEDPNPAWMISISLKPSVTFAAFLMLHFAWVNDFHGKYFLSGFVAVCLPILFFFSRVVFKSKREEYHQATASGPSMWLELRPLASLQKLRSMNESRDYAISNLPATATDSITGSFVVTQSCKEHVVESY